MGVAFNDVPAKQEQVLPDEMRVLDSDFFLRLEVELQFALQIHRAYHADSRVGGEYSRCADLEYSKQVVTAYMQRYAKAAWDAGDIATLARIHNGGPRGHLKPATLKYSQKVLRVLKK